MKCLTNIKDLHDWIAFDKSALPGMILSQAWKAENRLSGGVAKTAFSEGCLFVFADLPDEDIFNPVTEFNQRAFTEGDVFEIFLQVEGAEEYYEFHVSPTNQKFQLRFQRKREGEGMDAFDAALIEEPIESEVRLFPEEKRWEVFARIPLRRIGVADAHEQPLAIKGSFCRYDYTRKPEGGPSVELYSTSPHKKLSFHRRQEWRGLALS